MACILRKVGSCLSDSAVMNFIAKQVNTQLFNAFFMDYVMENNFCRILEKDYAIK